MASPTKTRTELIERAATELGVFTSGQELSQEDSDTLDALVEPLREQLSEDDVVEIGDLDQIELKYFIPFARLLANEAAPSFGQQYSEDAKISNERRLRKLSAERPTFETLRTTYF